MDNDSTLYAVTLTDGPEEGRAEDLRRLDSNEELQQHIDELTEALTPISDMAILLGLPESSLIELLDDRSTRCSQIYRRRRAQMALETRQREIEMARAGSPTSAANVQRYLSNSEL